MNLQDFNLVQPTQNTEGAKKNNTKLFIIIGCVVFFVIGLIAAFSSPNVDGMVKKYADACVDFNASKIVSLLHPKYVEYLEEEMDDDYKDLEDAIDSIFKEAEDEEDLDIKSYEIDEEFKEYDEEELALIAASMKMTFDIEVEDVKAVRQYKIKFTAMYEGEEDTENVELLMVQVGGKWYVFGDTFILTEVE